MARTFEEWHNSQATCCQECAEKCPHLEWERKAWEACATLRESELAERIKEARRDEAEWFCADGGRPYYERMQRLAALQPAEEKKSSAARDENKSK